MYSIRENITQKDEKIIIKPSTKKMDCSIKHNEYELSTCNKISEVIIFILLI